jgi:hypothetical protein
MKRPFFQRVLVSVVLAGAALGATSVAQARPDVQVSIGLPGLPVFLPLPPLPRPHFQAEPVYVQPRPIYAPPATVYERPWRPSYRDEAEREREWRHREWQRREWEHRHRDRDRGSHHDRHGWD